MAIESYAALDSAIRVLNDASDQLKAARRQGYTSAVRALRKLYKSQVIQETEYPPVPLPEMEIEMAAYGRTKNGDRIPNEAGIYFVWNEGRVVYVGTSVRISNRVNYNSHKNVHIGDFVSWLIFSNESERKFAELYYIGKLRPERNLPGLLNQNKERQYA